MNDLKPTFKNVHNKCINHEGKEYWISRAAAVTAIVTVKISSGLNKGKVYVLINQRGEKTPDYKLYWNLPCGYLDWNESSLEGCMREVYEETGLDIRSFRKSDQPIYVKTDPSSNRENVVLVHRFSADMAWEQFQQFEAGKNTLNSEPGEVNAIEFAEAITAPATYKFAFGHEDYIDTFIRPEIEHIVFEKSFQATQLLLGLTLLACALIEMTIHGNATITLCLFFVVTIIIPLRSLTKAIIKIFKNARSNN